MIAFGVAPVYGDPSVEGTKNNSGPGHEATSYYGWMNKFEQQEGRTNRGPRTGADVPPRAGQDGLSTLAKKGDVPAQSVAGPQIAPDGRNASDPSSSAKPGEGLGCYYHQAYYSHLPMFKDDIYSLRGSLDVSETYHKSTAVAASPPIVDSAGP